MPWFIIEHSLWHSWVIFWNSRKNFIRVFLLVSFENRKVSSSVAWLHKSNLINVPWNVYVFFVKVILNCQKTFQCFIYTLISEYMKHLTWHRQKTMANNACNTMHKEDLSVCGSLVKCSCSPHVSLLQSYTLLLSGQGLWCIGWHESIDRNVSRTFSTEHTNMALTAGWSFKWGSKWDL